MEEPSTGSYDADVVAVYMKLQKVADTAVLIYLPIC